MMSKTLQGYVNHLIIQKVQMDIYNRELERYGCNTIELSESFFYRDSVFILKYLRKVNSIDSDRWKISLRFINTLLNCNNYSLDDKIKFTEINANSYYNEFYRDNNESWKILNSKYRLKRNEIGIILNDKTSKVFKELDTFIFKYHFTNRRIFKEDFIVSVIHMHVNRMFRTRQRIVELVLYHFLHKYLLSEKAQIKYLEKVTVKNLIIRTPNNK
jgi:thiopeptide-type bacteriocin biosynthesis protein